ncbi:MAG TPA: DNA methyltransferase [Acidimicrobiales bacterium]|nr:DNA methyltransferase [Acidimicrobiales bacterium]
MTDTIPTELADSLAEGYELAFVNLDALEQHPDNPREGNVEVIAESIRENGFTAPLVCQTPRGDRAKGRILAGNHRYLAARRVGLKEVPVIWLDVDDVRAAKILVADNRTSDLATYDDPVLARILKDIADADSLIGTGFADEDLADLLYKVNGFRAGQGDEDAVPAAPTIPTTKLGDLWILGGEHRLLCGSSTDAADVARLLDGERPVAMLTDPPYGIELDHTWRDAALPQLAPGSTDHVANDDEDDWREAYRLSDATIALVWHAASHAHVVWEGLEDAGYEILQQIVWVKQRFSLGRSYYHWQHEPAWFARKKGRTVPFHVDRNRSTVWEAPSPKHIMSSKTDDKTAHPTQKPVSIYVQPLENHLHSGELAYDPFGGSGSLLIAAHKTGRRAALMELEPKWVDMMCQRYIDHSGLEVVNAETGELFPSAIDTDF